MIRLYGHTIGESSFVQITRGMQTALEAAGEFAGLVPIDALNDETVYPGADAPISINLGNPFGVLQAGLLGRHRERWLMIAPNSEKIPDSFVDQFANENPAFGKLFHGLLSPSHWGVEVLQRHFEGVPVVYAPHGVTPEIHRPQEQARSLTRIHYRNGEFRVLHLTSGRTRRKGTRELLRAWKECKDNGAVPRAAVLCVVLEPDFASEVQLLCNDYGLSVDTDGKSVADVTLRPGFGQSPTSLASLYSYCHLVAQPSRGEGFGIVTLEARACGVPVLATICTGHGTHLKKHDAGFVIVPHGKSGPVDDFDSSIAPTVKWEDIAVALAYAYSYWPRLDERAYVAGWDVRDQWSWKTVCRETIATLVERGEQHVRSAG